MNIVATFVQEVPPHDECMRAAAYIRAPCV